MCLRLKRLEKRHQAVDVALSTGSQHLEGSRRFAIMGEYRPIPWNELTPAQQEFQADKMAIHAAMVDRMDQEIGRLLQQIRDMGQMDNTVVMIMSDNGCSAEKMVSDDGYDPTVSTGSAATHLCLSPGWSTVSNTPFRRHKTWVHEGRIATPMIVHGPGVHAPGSVRHDPGRLIDVWPTLTQLARMTDAPRRARLALEWLCH